jgi:hypothetical protein
MTTMREAFDQERERLRNAAYPGGMFRRTPVLTLVGRIAARAVVALPRLRTTALSLGGFGCLVAAAWMVAVPAGLAAAGLSLLVLEYLSGEEGRRR